MILLICFSISRYVDNSKNRIVQKESKFKMLNYRQCSFTSIIPSSVQYITRQSIWGSGHHCKLFSYKHTPPHPGILKKKNVSKRIELCFF